jgi:hypothetical protein
VIKMSCSEKMIKSKCQICKEPILIKMNTPYFGKFCGKCSTHKTTYQYCELQDKE